MKIKVKQLVLENLNYKVVSFFITLVLWVAVLEKKDVQVTRAFEVNFLLGQQQVLEATSHDSVNVKIIGPQTMVRNLNQQILNQKIPISLFRVNGEDEVIVSSDKLEFPAGVRILSVKPDKIQVRVGQKLNIEDKDKEQKTKSRKRK
jgi:hypothetical protein